MTEPVKEKLPEQGAPPDPQTPPAPAVSSALRQGAARGGKKTGVPTHYHVLHSAVGVYRGGETIAASDLKDVDVQRLVDLGALAATDAPEDESK